MIAPALSPLFPAALRAELEHLVILDLLGPASGPEERIAESGVWDRYLIEMLALRQQMFARGGNSVAADLIGR